MILNKISDATPRQHLVGAIIVAVAVTALAAIAMLLFGPNIASANHGGPHIDVGLSGNKLVAEISNADEVTVDSDTWQWIRYDADTADDTGSGFVGCGPDSFGLSSSAAPTPYDGGSGAAVTLTSADNGLTYCFMVADEEGTTNTMKYPGTGDATINIAAAGYEDPKAGSKPDTVPEAGVEEDLLLGGLFIFGVAASVACSKIWLDTYKRHKSAQSL